MKALILAAGDNTRFRKNNKQNKLLQPVLGVSLLERTVRNAKEAGVVEFIIVTGYQDDEIKGLLGDGKKFGVNIIYVHNQSWRGENGISVYTAKDLIDDNFILLMGDHLFSPKVLTRLKRVALGKKECILAVDRKTSQYFNIGEATKVQITKGKIAAIGKELTEYNGMDTGIFFCSPYLFLVLKTTIANNNFYLTDAMRVIAKEKRLKSLDVKDAFWADIDTHADLQFAEKKLLDSLIKPEDGVISRIFNRKVSTQISRFLVHLPFKPNQLSLLTLLFAILTAVILAQGTSFGFILGGILIQFLSIFDGCDGEVARLKFLESNFGAWLDGVLDKYVDTLIIVGLTLGSWQVEKSAHLLLVAIFAFLGIMLDGYVPNKYIALFKRRLKWGGVFGFYFKRDSRLLLLVLGAISGQILVSLVLLAVFTHLSTFLRLWAGRRYLANSKS